MRTAFRVLTLCMLTFFLSACAPKVPAPAESLLDDIRLAVEAAARQTVLSLTEGDYAAVAAHFDRAMEKALPGDALKQAWETTAEQAGAFYEIVSAESFSLDGYRVCNVTARHELRGIVSRVVYDTEMRIAGLFFTYIENHSAPAESETAVTIGTEFPLSGLLALPDGAEKVPAVVLVHGSGPSDRDESAFGIKVFKDISDCLSARGIAVLRYDKRTYTHGAQMTGDITVSEETIEDAILAGRLLAEHERVDSARIFVVGHSLGGMLAPRIVEESGGVFAGAVIMAGSLRSLTEIVYDQNMYFISLASETEREELTRQVEAARPYFGIPQAYIDEMDAHPAGGYLADSDKPYLILQGGKDFQVSVEKDFEGYRQLLGSKSNFEFRLYDGLTHFFTQSTMEKPTAEDYIAGAQVDDRPLEDITNWINAQ